MKKKDLKAKNELLKELAGMTAETAEGYVVEIVDADSLDSLHVRFKATGKIVSGVTLRQFTKGEIVYPVEFGMTKFNKDGDPAVVTAVDKKHNTLTLQFANGRISQNVPVEIFRNCMFDTPTHAVHTEGHLTGGSARGTVTEFSQEFELQEGGTVSIDVKKNTGIKAGHEALRDKKIVGARRQAQSTGDVAYVIDNSKGRNNLMIIFVSDEAVKTGVNKTKFMNGQFGRHSNIVMPGEEGYPAEIVEKFFEAHPEL